MTDRSAGMVPGLVFLASFLVRGAVVGLYHAIERDLPGPIEGLLTLLFFIGLCSWFASYSRAHRIAWPMDMGVFLWLLWFVLVPYYVFKAEGRRGWGLIAIFLMAAVAAWGVYAAVTVWLRLLLHE
jgi:hypothetical protein